MDDLQALVEATNALQHSAALAYQQGRFADGARGFAEVTQTLVAAGLSPNATVLASEGNCRLALGELDAAVTLYRRSAQAANANADLLGEAAAYSGLAYAHQHRSQLEEAVAALQRAAEAFEVAGERIASAETRAQMGGVLFTMGRHREAAKALESALPAARDVGTPHFLCTQLVSTAGVLLSLGRHEEASALLNEAAEVLPADYVGTAVEAALTRNLGIAELAVGRFDAAHEALSRAKTVVEGLGDHAMAAQLAATLSDVHRFDGDLDGAIIFHREMMGLQEAHGLPALAPERGVRTRVVDQSLGTWAAPDGLVERGAVGAEPVAETFGHVGTARGGDRPFVIFSPAVLGTWGPLFPRGAVSVASYLNAHGVPTVVVPLSHYVGPFTDAEQADAIVRSVVADVLGSLSPRAVGLSVTFSHLYPAGLRVAAAVRDLAGPDLPIIIGGPHVTYWDEECLSEAPAIDIVVRGEGEWTALELLTALDRGAALEDVMGITYRGPDGAIRKTRIRKLGSVAELPAVDLDLLPRAFAGRMEVSGVTSRGCAYRCRFCHEFRFWGGAVREYEPDRIVAEMARIHALGNRMRGIDDSMLSMQSEYFFKLCDHLAGSPYIGDGFGFLTRVHTIAPDGIDAMRRAGIKTVTVGLESGSDVVLKAMNKGVSLDEALAGLRYARDQGGGEVGVHAFFIVGHPGDNPTESDKTLAFADGLFQDDLVSWIDVAMFNPYPGTPFFTFAAKHGVEILTMDWERWRRTNRPIAQLEGYPASGIYLSYLRMLQLMTKSGRVDVG